MSETSNSLLEDCMNSTAKSILESETVKGKVCNHCGSGHVNFWQRCEYEYLLSKAVVTLDFEYKKNVFGHHKGQNMMPHLSA